jgi:hypothetical protein
MKPVASENKLMKAAHVGISYRRESALMMKLRLKIILSRPGDGTGRYFFRIL